MEEVEAAVNRKSSQLLKADSVKTPEKRDRLRLSNLKALKNEFKNGLRMFQRI